MRPPCPRVRTRPSNSRRGGTRGARVAGWGCWVGGRPAGAAGVGRGASGGGGGRRGGGASAGSRRGGGGGAARRAGGAKRGVRRPGIQPDDHTSKPQSNG